MKSLIFFIVLFVFNNCSFSQEKIIPRLVGGPCDGCEAIFEYGEKILSPVDTLPGFESAKNKIRLSGIIFQKDGITPAKDVILYIYHTDQTGIYSVKGNETGLGKSHGYSRGWVKTDADGKYTFYTFIPGVYPTRTEPAHIHPTILEPDGKYYYIEDYYFEGDDLLKEKHIKPESPRGGSTGVVSLKNENDLLISRRDIILGRNIPGYD